MLLARYGRLDDSVRFSWTVGVSVLRSKRCMRVCDGADDDIVNIRLISPPIHPRARRVSRVRWASMR